MTVKELIEALSKFDPDMEVLNYENDEPISYPNDQHILKFKGYNLKIDWTEDPEKVLANYKEGGAEDVELAKAVYL